jgi:hypothetical protein
MFIVSTDQEPGTPLGVRCHCRVDRTFPGYLIRSVKGSCFQFDGSQRSRDIIFFHSRGLRFSI